LFLSEPMSSSDQVAVDVEDNESSNSNVALNSNNNFVCLSRCESDSPSLDDCNAQTSETSAATKKCLTLDRLPEDVLGIVFRHVRLRYRMSLLLTCKKFCRIALARSFPPWEKQCRGLLHAIEKGHIEYFLRHKMAAGVRWTNVCNEFGACFLQRAATKNNAEMFESLTEFVVCTPAELQECWDCLTTGPALKSGSVQKIASCLYGLRMPISVAMLKRVIPRAQYERSNENTWKSFLRDMIKAADELCEAPDWRHHLMKAELDVIDSLDPISELDDDYEFSRKVLSKKEKRKLKKKSKKEKKKSRICPKRRFKYFQATRDAIDEL
jgi:hypothetical protein